jgi:hypothetical protein
VLWSRWVLARLDEVLGGDVALLAQELRGKPFSRDDLEVRFDEVGLDELFADDQQRLGVAVAHRAMNGTFVIRESGIDPLLDRASQWPEAYRFGVAEGLLLDLEGRASWQGRTLSPRSRRSWPRWLGWIGSGWEDQLVAAPIQSALANDEAKRGELLTAFYTAALELPEGAQRRWDFLTALFDLPAADSD